MVSYLSLFMPQNTHSHLATDSLPQLRIITSKMTAIISSHDTYTLVTLSADARKTKPICLGPPLLPHQLNDPSKKGQHCKISFLESYSHQERISLSATIPVAKRMISLSKRWLVHSYLPCQLISLKFFQLFCLKGSQSALIP